MSSALLALVLAQAWYTPDEAQALYAQANDAYYRQDHAAAIDGYQKLLARGMGGSDVLFNLGTAYLAKGDLGHAVLYLERARRLAPDDDVEANLAVAQSRQVDQVVGAGQSEPFLERLVHATDERLFGLGLAAGLWAALVALVLVRRLGGTGKVLSALALAAALLVTLATGAVFGAHALVARTVREAVVVQDVAKVREFPGESAKVGFELHAGLRLRVKGEQGRYVQVRLANGLEGWTERDAVEDL